MGQKFGLKTFLDIWVRFLQLLIGFKNIQPIELIEIPGIVVDKGNGPWSGSFGQLGSALDKQAAQCAIVLYCNIYLYSVKMYT